MTKGSLFEIRAFPNYWGGWEEKRKLPRHHNLSRSSCRNPFSNLISLSHKNQNQSCICRIGQDLQRRTMNIDHQNCILLEKGGATKSDEFLETFQTAFYTPLIFRKLDCKFLDSNKCIRKIIMGMVVYVQGNMSAR